MVPTPRIFIERRPSSAPPFDVPWMSRPGVRPIRASTAVVTGRSLRSSDETVDTAPVRLTFFCVPKPTATTSLSDSTLSSRTMLSGVPFHFASSGLQPTKENRMVVPVLIPGKENLPSISVVHPFRVPIARTETPARGSPVWSVTVPVAAPVDCADAPELKAASRNAANSSASSRIGFLVFFGGLNIKV